MELPTLVGTGHETVGIANGNTDLSASGLISISEDVSVEFVDERASSGPLSVFVDDKLPTVFSITKNLTAQGASLPTGDVEAWELAQRYVKSELGNTGNFASYFSGAMCTETMTIVSNFRTFAANRTDGSCVGSQTFVAMTGADYALEEFEGSLDEAHDSPFTTVTLNGTVQGFTTIADYDDCPPSGNENKFDNAYSKWQSISGLLHHRATKVYDEAAHSRPSLSLNTGVPLSRAIGYNPIAGTITYSVSYDDRFVPYWTGAVSESISLSKTKTRPDLYASLTILGRTAGPLLQPLGTYGPATREVSVDAIVTPSAAHLTGHADASDGYSGLFGTNDDELLTSDVETWDARAGHYTRSASWEIGSC